MKRIIYLFWIASFALFISSCNKDEASLVNEDGLTQEIVNLVPDSILNEIKSLGMPIYGGENPPNIENSYIASPFVLKASNREYDQIGYTYSDYYVKFYNQDNSKLTISMNYANGPETGEGMGSYIVGKDNKFTVFVEVNAETEDGSKAKMVHIISGEWTADGIKDFYFANFMLDNFGNPTGYWIENGQGRIVYDSDGFSEVTDLIKSVKESDLTGAGAK
ncbi:MAG: hypothetical protein L3J74_12245 [Bacteroidales bacterium]|nr:hypothetical protein [Bacteroidales bacterium]